MALIEIEQVEKRYRLGEVEVHALRGLSLELREGELLALMGASGSGKTTLLNILGCLDAPTSGSYRLAGEKISARDHDKLAPLRADTIGFVFQSFNLIPVLSAQENVELPMLWKKRAEPPAQRKKRALELLEAVGMKEHASRRPTQLSGGQQQRVAVARSLANRPKLVLADEPTANLDTATADQVLDAMTSLWRRENATFVFATHDPRILSRATRVVYIVDGKVGVGPMQDPETGLFNRPYFENRLQEELRHAARHGEPCSLMFLEVDAPAGRAAEILRGQLRGSDTIARYQHGVFAALLLGAPEPEARRVAERVIAALHEDTGTRASAALIFGQRGASLERILESALEKLDEARASEEREIATATVEAAPA